MNSAISGDSDNKYLIYKMVELDDYWNKGGFVLCTAGNAEVRINEQNVRLTRGSVFVVTPLVQVSGFRPMAGCRTVACIHDLKQSYPIFRLIADTHIPLNISRQPCWRLSDNVLTYVVGRVRQFAAKRAQLAAAASDDERRLLGMQLEQIRHETMLEVVGDHLRRFPPGASGSSRPVSVAYRFILSLHEHYARQRSVAWYAAEAQLSAGHFTTLIRRATGKSPSQWIATVTTAYAKLLLEQDGQSIKEIAQRLGFPEQFTFRKYFKQHAGLSPKAYRAQRLYAHR